MRSLISLAFMAVLMTLAVPLQAQDVTGDWTITYSMMGRQGGQAREVSMDVSLQQDGAVVTGTALMARHTSDNPTSAIVAMLARRKRSTNRPDQINRAALAIVPME